MNRLITIICCLLLVWIQADQVIFGEEEQPNIVLILADDLGYGDVQPLNSQSKIPTPSFNLLASEGMTFTDAHSPSAVCTPTRYGLLCGRYPWRTDMKRGVLGGYSKPLIKHNRLTIATVLKQAGYQTCCIGKWHLGLGWQWQDDLPKDINNMGIAGGKAGLVDYSKPLTHGPTFLGFDSSLIIPASLDMSPYVYVRDDRVTQIPEQTLPGQKFPQFYRKGEIAADFEIGSVLDTLTKEACQFIDRASERKKPFFLYFPLTAPHKPVIPAARFKNKTKLGPYGDFVAQVDWTVGEVLRTLDEKQLAKNTIVIVTSDNGSFMHRYDKQEVDHSMDPKVHGYNPKIHTANGPLRGTKADVWEAGHRVPFFVRWPDKIAGGESCNVAICQTDILATLAEITNQDFDESSAEDSHSFRGLMAGGIFDRLPIVHQSGSGHLAIRSGKWKLVMSNGSGGRQKPKGKRFEEPYQLFDLSDDLSETKNLIDSHSQVKVRLHQQFLSISHGDHQMSNGEKPD